VLEVFSIASRVVQMARERVKEGYGRLVRVRQMRKTVRGTWVAHAPRVAGVVEPARQQEVVGSNIGGEQASGRQRVARR